MTEELARRLIEVIERVEQRLIAVEAQLQHERAARDARMAVVRPADVPADAPKRTRKGK